MTTEDEQTLDLRRQQAETELTALVKQRYPMRVRHADPPIAVHGNDSALDSDPSTIHPAYVPQVMAKAAYGHCVSCLLPPKMHQWRRQAGPNSESADGAAVSSTARSASHCSQR